MLIFFIHGVATRDAQYAEPLRAFIRQEFNNKGKFPHFHASFWGNFLGDRDRMWNGIDQDLQELRQESPQANLEDIFRYRKFREGFLSQFAGDFLAYLNPQRGIAIRKVIAQDLDNLLRENPEEMEIHIIAHSLGSVILWDILFSERFSPKDPAFEIRAMINGLNQPNAAHQVSLKSITTMGSPILFLNTMLDVKPEQVKQFVAGYQEEPLRWLNIIHASDVVAYPLRASLKLNSFRNLFFRDNYICADANLAEKAARIVGQLDAAMALGVADAHSCYWNAQITGNLITDNILGNTKNLVNSSTNTNLLFEAIIRLGKVPGITTDKMSLHINDQPLSSVSFRDSSGKIHLVVNALNIHHVYVFDSSNSCKFAGYVGWMHIDALKKEFNFIKSNFG